MSLTPTLLITPLIDLIVGKVIEGGTNGDAAKINAKAVELKNINNALIAINSGDAAGLVALQAALNTTSLDLGTSLALQSLFSQLGGQLALLQKIAGGTILGTANTTILDSILGAASAVADAYIAKYPVPA